MNDKEVHVNRLILSKNHSFPEEDADTSVRKNVLVLGGAVAGKKFNCIIPNLLQASEASGSYVITDVTGTLYKTYGAFLKNKGYDVRCFNLESNHIEILEECSCDPEGDECSYNPFHYMETDLEAEEFAEILVTNAGSQPADQKWHDGKMALMTALVALVKDHTKKDQRMPATMLETITGEDPRIVEARLDGLFGLIKKDQPESFAVSRYEEYRSEEDEEIRFGILMACNVLLQPFSLSAIGRLTGTDTISIDTVWKKKTALFIITPSYPTPVGFLVSALYSQIFDKMVEEYVRDGCQPLPVHTTFIMDQFANFGKIPYCAIKMLMVPRCGAACMLLLPSLFMLQNLYADMEEWKGITASFGAVLMLRINASCGAVLMLSRKSDPVPLKWLAEYCERKIERHASPAHFIRTIYQVLSGIAGVRYQYQKALEKEPSPFIYDEFADFGRIPVLDVMKEGCSANNESIAGDAKPVQVQPNSCRTPMFDPEELRSMSPDKCLVVLAGTGAYIDDKYNAQEHPNWEAAENCI